MVKKKGHILFFITLLLLVLLCFNTEAQEERGYLTIKGSAKLYNKPLENVKVLVYRDKSKFAETVTSRKGKFSIKLEYYYLYDIKFVKDGCVKMHMLVNTKVPANTLPLWSTYYIDVPFFKTTDTTVNQQQFEKPFTRVAFYPKKLKFIDDLNYTNEFTNDLFSENAAMPAMEKSMSKKEDIIIPPANKAVQGSTLPASPDNIAESKNMEQSKIRNNMAVKSQRDNVLLEEAYRQKKIKERENVEKNVEVASRSSISSKKPEVEYYKRQAEKEKEKRTNASVKADNMNSVFVQTGKKTKKAPKPILKPTVRTYTEENTFKKSVITEIIFPEYKIILIKDSDFRGAEKYYKNDTIIDKAIYDQIFKSVE